MEEFLNIDWHPPLEDIVDDVFINEQRMKNESVMYRIMQGLFTNPFHEFESDDSGAEDETEGDDEMDNKFTTKQEKTKRKIQIIQKLRDYVPGIVKSSVKFPRLSNLSREQQAICLRVLLRFSGQEKAEINSANRSELDLYMKLCPTIRKEQEEFLELAKSNWKGTELKVTGKEYINERWESKVQIVQELPRYYVAGRNIPFNGNEKISLTPEATLLETGQIPRIIIPFGKKKRSMLPCKIDKLRVLYPACNNSTLQKLTVSKDPNCERLAESGEADLVISSGGLNCLASNFGPNYTSSWILPIVVKKSERGNVIYVDKPLAPTAMTVPQKNAWIYKYILKSGLLHPNHHTSISWSEQDRQTAAEHALFGDPYSDDLLKLEEEHDELSSYSVKKVSDQLHSTEASISSGKQSTINKGDLTSLETKDEFYSFVKKNRLQSTPQRLSANPPDGDESKSTKEDPLETQGVSMESVITEDTELSSNTKTNANNEEDIIDDQTEQIFDAETNDPQNSTNTIIPPTSMPAANNVAYKIFRLCPSVDTNNDSIKTKVGDYRILVRTRIDGIEKVDKGTLRPVMLVPKLEHQVDLGAEAVTAEEALKQWTTLTYRPDTSLIRVRISAETSEVIQVERRTAISINNEIKRLYNLNVEDSLITLHNVVHDLKALKLGNYLLRHTPTNGAFATIYQEADISGKNVFDLHATYAQNSLHTISNPPWPALDTLVVTPSQICFERMPAMYHPPRTDTALASKVTRGRERGGSRGRGRGISRGGGTGRSQDSGIGDSRRGARGGTKVRTKKGKKKNKKVKTETQES